MHPGTEIQPEGPVLPGPIVSMFFALHRTSGLSTLLSIGETGIPRTTCDLLFFPGTRSKLMDYELIWN